VVEGLKTSVFIKRLMFQMMKKADNVSEGFLQFNHRTIVECELDEPECDILLTSMVINKKNVVQYLERKYIPTYVANGAIFKNQKCIQKAFVGEDGTLTIHIKNSEPHKIITDTIHVRNLLIGHGFKLSLKTKYYIDALKIALQDVLLYNLMIKEFGYQVPEVGQRLEKKLLFTYGIFENVVKIKKRSIKRKILRFLVKKGDITWKQLREVVSLEDYSPNSVRQLTNRIIEEQRALGIKIK